MKFIKLTYEDNTPVYVNMALVVGFEEYNRGAVSCTRITLSYGTTTAVQETPEQILALLNE